MAGTRCPPVRTHSPGHHGLHVVKKTSRIYGPSSWFPVGTDSDCMLFSSNGDPAPHLVFTFNDNNLGDNSGGAGVVVRQWF